MLGAPIEDARRVWFVLHGYGQLAASVLRVFDGIVPADTCVVAPEALSRLYREMPRPDGRHLEHVGASWMTRESRESEIRDALHWLGVVYKTVMSAGQQVEAIGVLGFSQGVAMAGRWVGSGALKETALRHLVLWAGHLATELDLDVMHSALANVQLTFVAGDRDPFLVGDTLTSLTHTLETWQTPFTLRRFSGMHQLNRELLKELLQNMEPHT